MLHLKRKLRTQGSNLLGAAITCVAAFTLAALEHTINDDNVGRLKPKNMGWFAVSALAEHSPVLAISSGQDSAKRVIYRALS